MATPDWKSDLTKFSVRKCPFRNIPASSGAQAFPLMSLQGVEGLQSPGVVSEAAWVQESGVSTACVWYVRYKREFGKFDLK